MGPVSAKTYPGELWKSKDGLLAGYQPDYGRRGKTWVFGAFEPETGQAFTLCHDRRDSIGYIQLLEGVFERFPAKEWVLIADNLSTHISKDTPAALLAFDQQVQMLFIPKSCCWLNLIEPWWKELRSLALKGRRFEDSQPVIGSLQKATLTVTIIVIPTPGVRNLTHWQDLILHILQDFAMTKKRLE
jgi:transposase